VKSVFSCTDGTNGPGIESWKDEHGISAPAEGKLNTSSLGSHEYKVTAISKDGETETASIKYTVAAPPEAKIEFPTGGGTYKEGEIVATTFSCKEGEFGPGLESCKDSNGATGGVGALNTSGLGLASYEVTAKSKDGATGTVSIEYTVITACKSASGNGRVGSVSSEGVIFYDELSKSSGAKEKFEAGIQKSSLGRVYMTSLTSAACVVIPGGLEYRGQGPATLKGVPGYHVAFSFAVVGSHISFSIELKKGATLEYEQTNATAVPGSVEHLST
jgi:hypothetical protein